MDHGFPTFYGAIIETWYKQGTASYLYCSVHLCLIYWRLNSLIYLPHICNRDGILGGYSGSLHTTPFLHEKLKWGWGYSVWAQAPTSFMKSSRFVSSVGGRGILLVQHRIPCSVWFRHYSPTRSSFASQIVSHTLCVWKLNRIKCCILDPLLYSTVL